MNELPGDPIDRFRLSGKVALVTGASSGIGAGLARGLHRAGASVVLVARRSDRLTEASASMGDRALAISADVSVKSEVRDAFQEASERFGGIDVLVNAAGISLVTPAESEEEENIREIIETNLIGTYFCAQAAANLMLEGRGGSIINIASIIGLVGMGFRPQAAYCASKGGVVNLTRELAAQWATRGIRVNAIAPGTFVTEMSDRALDDAEVRTWVEERTPMRRLGNIPELVGPCIFLASDASSFVTGQILAVDGGWTAV